MREITVLGIFQSLLFILVMEDFYSTVLKKKEKDRIYHFILWSGYFLYHLWIMRIFPPVWIKTLGNLGMIFIILLLRYCGNIRTKLIVDFLGLFLISAVEVIAVIIIRMMNPESDLSNPVYGVISNTVFWVLVHFVFGVIKNTTGVITRKKYLIVFGGMVLGNGIFGLIIYKIGIQTEDQTVQGLALGLAIALLLIDIIGFRMYNMLLQKMYIQNENEKYVVQLQINEQQMAERQAVMENIKRMRHDMKQQLIYLQELVRENPTDADVYLRELIENTQSNAKDVIQSGNAVMDALLNHKYFLASKYHIEMKIQILVPSELPQSPADLCIIIGNLLDNAIEAAKITRERKIEVVVKYEHKKLYINIINPYRNPVEKDKSGNYITQKKDKENHGVGLDSVKNCVEKNQGILLIDTSDNIFKVTVVI